MCLNPYLTSKFMSKAEDELREIDEISRNIMERLAIKKENSKIKRNEQKNKLQERACNAFIATQDMQKKLDTEYKADRRLRQSELTVRKEYEKEEAKNRKVDWIASQTRYIEMTQLRQQNLDRDSNRDKRDLANKVDKFKDVLDYKTEYNNNYFHKKTLAIEKIKMDYIDIYDASTRLENARGDTERFKIMAEKQQYMVEEARKDANESCERTVNKAIEHNIPVNRKGNVYDFDLF